MVSECFLCPSSMAALAAAGLFAYFFHQRVKGNSQRRLNRERISANVSRRDAASLALRESLASSANSLALTEAAAILSLSLLDLQRALQDGRWTASQVLRAFQAKALEVTAELNCVTDFLKEATAEAAALDEKFSGQPKPPLFGLPFSVKDNFWVRGYSCTRGLGSELGRVEEATCSFVEHLRSLGAVAFCRTNVPQTLLQYVTTNPVWGTTKHPLDGERNPGGSSGGECALLAAGGSAFGIGSDLGGSLRIPAAFCGLVSLKPSSKRFLISQCHPGIPGCPKIALSSGFFAKTVAGQEFLLRTFLTPEFQARLPQMVPLPWGSVNGHGEKAPLKIGYFVDDGWLKAVPAMARGVEVAAAALRKEGHVLVPFALPSPAKGLTAMVRNMVSDNGAYLRKCMVGNDADPLIKPALALLGLPLCLRPLMGRLAPGPQLKLMAAAYNASAGDVAEAGALADEYVAEFTTAWKAAGLDALLCPAFPFPAPRHDLPAKLPAAAFATGLFNLLDFPAAVLPVTSVTEEDDTALAAQDPPPSLLRNPVEKIMFDSALGSKGLPVAVQLVTLPYQDELCLHILQIIENALPPKA